MIILGPPCCGKSELAQQTALERGGRVIYLGTLARLPANRVRIERHRQTRPRHWRLVEIQRSLLECTACEAARDDIVLLDGFHAYLQRKVEAETLFGVNLSDALHLVGEELAALTQWSRSRSLSLILVGCLVEQFKHTEVSAAYRQMLRLLWETEQDEVLALQRSGDAESGTAHLLVR